MVTNGAVDMISVGIIQGTRIGCRAQHSAIFFRNCQVYSHEMNLTTTHMLGNNSVLLLSA